MHAKSYTDNAKQESSMRRRESRSRVAGLLLAVFVIGVGA